MFLTQLAKVINTGQSRSVILTGNVYDLFFDGEGWVPLLELLRSRYKSERQPGQKGVTQIIWQVNRPIEVVGEANLRELGAVWSKLHSDSKSLKTRLEESLIEPVLGFEVLRQVTECARAGKLVNNLLIVIEAADMLLPDAPISHMSMPDRKRVSIVQDWFSDPAFVNGHDSVVLVSESRNAVHSRISRLPQVLSVEVQLPSLEDRKQFAEWHAAKTQTALDTQSLAESTSGLSLHAVQQLLRSGDHSPRNVTAKVEDYMVSQLGEGVVEFKRPTHTLNDVVGFRRLKAFFRDELLPTLRDGKDCLSGMLVCGPIGGGKTFICEALASEIGAPVIVLKNLRSKWYGETDQIFERLRRLLEKFHRAMIFVDEADTVFGSVDSEQDTERRLTGKLQAMMSDAAFRGRVVWCLMTARVHKLSPDIRRSGRTDLIVPILDPQGDDLWEFMEWTFGELAREGGRCEMERATAGYSAAEFALLRSRIRAEAKTFEDAIRIASDIVAADIAATRSYQTFQAMVNCTRISLMFDGQGPAARKRFLDERSEWQKAIVQLEAAGVR